MELILHWLVNPCFPTQICLLADVGRKQTLDQRLKPLQGERIAIEKPIKIATTGKIFPINDFSLLFYIVYVSVLLFRPQFSFCSGNPADSADYEVEVPRGSSVAVTADDPASATA